MLPDDLSQLQPIIDSRTGCVDAWRVRLTLKHESHMIFDDLELPIEEMPVGPGSRSVRYALQKPLQQWTQCEVVEFFARAPRLHAQRDRLTRILEQRCFRMPMIDFMIESLQGE